MNAPIKAENKKQDALEVVIAELAQSLEIMESNYRKAVSNLNSLKQCVETDDLTRLLRRGAFMRKLDLMLTQAREEGNQVQLMMLDVDHFKKVNDTHGHQTGDLVLERISSLIKQYLRNDDLAGRYGGEEIIVAVECSEIEALTLAEAIRSAVQTHVIESKSMNTDASSLRVTLSIGMASSTDTGFKADILIAHADEALYSAKHSGRNQVKTSNRKQQNKTAA